MINVNLTMVFPIYIHSKRAFTDSKPTCVSCSIPHFTLSKPVIIYSNCIIIIPEIYYCTVPSFALNEAAYAEILYSR